MGIVFILCMAVLTGCSQITKRVPPLSPVERHDLKEMVSPPAKQKSPPRWRKRKFKTRSQREHVPKNMMQKVSLTLTESQPLKDTLIEIARQLKIDLHIDPKIKARVIYSAHNKPFIDIVRTLCRRGGLRYVIDGDGLSIMADVLYAKNYNMQFLNMSRDSQNRMSISTDIFTDVGGKGAKTRNDNGSNSEVQISGSSDFWGELENNLKIILSGGQKKATYSVHKQGGLISIFANQEQHDLVEEYLEKLRAISRSQVLIEAKIIEVSLLDNFRSGINWQKIGTSGDLRLSSLMGDHAKSGRFLDTTTAQTDLVSIGGAGKDFSGILNALEQFGHSRTLSSPRLTVMNNQTAVLKIAQNQVYFRLHYDKQYSTINSQHGTSVSSDIQTVPIGLVMSVQPSIDEETGEVILFLRPTVSKMAQSVSDPAVQIAHNANLVTGTNAVDATPSLVPVVEVKEIDSILRVQSGEVAVLGGLMEVRSTKDNSGIPGFATAPILKDVFGAQSESDQVVELVILLKVTIVEDAPKEDPADRRLMDKYLKDPRPL